MENQLFARKLIEWYQINKRNLPWRHTTDPYQIWLSEIILQQTRVVQGLPYYQAFTQKFPQVSNLAQAEEQEVLRTWQGLGYYSRARNLHKCAKIICHQYGGQFPDNYAELIKLPGIGPYTAAAIASFAFKEPKAVVDGNVYRVLSRFFGLQEDIASNSGQKAFAKLAQTLINHEHPDLYNQGIMEFGALHCTPKSPACNNCMFIDNCVAFDQKLQNVLPIKSKKVKVRLRHFYYINVVQNDLLLMKKRVGNGIWEGLYDFYLHESSDPLDHQNITSEIDFLRSLVAKTKRIDLSKEYVHILSHQKIKARFITVYIQGVSADIMVEERLKFYPLDEVHDLPKPVLISHYLNDTFF